MYLNYDCEGALLRKYLCSLPCSSTVITSPVLPLVVFLLGYLASLFIGSFLFGDSERFSFQWQSLIFFSIVSLGIFSFFTKARFLFLPWLFESRARWILLGSGVYLLSMLASHGWLSQWVGLCSGFVFLYGLLVALFLSSLDQPRLLPLAVFSFGIVGVLAFEDAYLVVYHFNGLNASSIVVDGFILPRVFVNVRDGNALALAVSALAVTLEFVRPCNVRYFSFVFSHSRLIVPLLWLLVFLNGWLTQARGLFAVSLLSFLIASITSSSLVGRLSSAFRVFVVLVASWLLYQSISLMSSHSFVAASMLQRTLDDFQLSHSGRLQVWHSWLSVGLGKSLWFGQGLGVKSLELNSFIEKTPHNIIVQIASDSGLLGLLISAFVAVFVCLYFRSLRMTCSAVVIYAFLCLFLYSQVASVVFWPTGVWLVVSGAVFLAPALNNPGLARGAKSGLFVVLAYVLMLPLFVLLSSSKSLLLV